MHIYGSANTRVWKQFNHDIILSYNNAQCTPIHYHSWELHDVHAGTVFKGGDLTGSSVHPKCWQFFAWQISKNTCCYILCKYRRRWATLLTHRKMPRDAFLAPQIRQNAFAAGHPLRTSQSRWASLQRFSRLPSWIWGGKGLESGREGGKWRDKKGRERDGKREGKVNLSHEQKFWPRRCFTFLLHEKWFLESSLFYFFHTGCATAHIDVIENVEKRRPMLLSSTTNRVKAYFCWAYSVSWDRPVSRR